MSQEDEREDRIRGATLSRGDIDDLTALKETLDEGYNIGRADAYALIAEIRILQAKYEEARSTRNMLIRHLGKTDFGDVA